MNRANSGLSSNFHNATIGIDFNPVTVLNDLERILIKVGHRRYPHDYGAKCHLGCELIENYR